MKKVGVAIVLLLAVAGKALAGDAQGIKPAKDLCLLDSSNCPGNFSYDIHEKIRRLNTALKQGETVYTSEELEHLENIRRGLRDSLDFDNNDFLYEE
jgi:hypothetical protein